METQTLDEKGVVHSVRIARRYNASPEELYDALLNPEALARWFGPSDEMSVEAEVDAVEGGAYRISMTHLNGNNYVVGGRFTKLVPFKQIEFSWQWEGEEMAAMGETTVTYTIEPLDGGSELVLFHDGFPVEEAAKGHNTGWNGGMWRLERLFGSSVLQQTGLTLALNRKLYENALKSVTTEELQKRPGDSANHLLWVAGHLASTRTMIAKLLGADLEDEMAIFSKAIDTSAEYPSIEAVVEYFAKATGKLLERLPIVSDDQLRGPAPMQMPVNDATLLGAITFLVQHESYHVGQMGLLRKILGHEATSYS